MFHKTGQKADYIIAPFFASTHTVYVQDLFTGPHQGNNNYTSGIFGLRQSGHLTTVLLIACFLFYPTEPFLNWGGSRIKLDLRLEKYF